MTEKETLRDALIRSGIEGIHEYIAFTASDGTVAHLKDDLSEASFAETIIPSEAYDPLQ